MKALAALCFFFFLTNNLCPNRIIGQSSISTAETNAGLPLVFVLGEKGLAYETISTSYQTLLDACDRDMPEAYQKLFSMMKEMEAFAELVDFDLEGINAWMHFFWRQDGSIEHIGFHLKPNSKNVKRQEFEEFLKHFALQYKFPLVAGTQYSHYSSFSFPVK